MRNLPQFTHVGGTFKSDQIDGRASDESFETICPTRWPVSPDATCMLRSSMSPSRSADGRSSARPIKRTKVCTYLVQHRARLLLTFVSLVFLSLFLLVIYRQFGLVVFASTLSLIVVPGLVALLYAKRLKAREQEKARQRALNRSSSQRQSQRQPKTVQIYSTDVEIAMPNSIEPRPVPKLQRKATQQKITIHLPPSVSEN